MNPWLIGLALVAGYVWWSSRSKATTKPSAMPTATARTLGWPSQQGAGGFDVGNSIDVALAGPEESQLTPEANAFLNRGRAPAPTAAEVAIAAETSASPVISQPPPDAAYTNLVTERRRFTSGTVAAPTVAPSQPTTTTTVALASGETRTRVRR